MNEEKKGKLIFSIYALRDERDFTIFDREIENLPGSSKPHMYNCVGVFEVETYLMGSPDVESDEMWPQFLYDPVGRMGLVASIGLMGIVAPDEWKFGPWRLGSEAIMRGDFTDKLSGRTALIKKLWMSAPEGEA